MLENISLEKIALILFVLCAGWAVIRGVARMLLNSILFVASGWLTYQAWGLSAKYINQHLIGVLPVKPIWIDISIPVLVFFSCFFILRWIILLIINPLIKGSSIDSKPQGAKSILFRIAFALIPSSLLGAIGMSAFHHLGTISEIKKNAWASSSSDLPDFFKKMKLSSNQLIPEKIMRQMDPLSDPQRVRLAKALARDTIKNVKPAIDPDTGKPIPRAKPVIPQELETLAKAGDYGAILRHPDLDRVLKNPRVQEYLNLSLSN